MGPITIFNRQFMRASTLDGSLMALCGVTYTEFPDLAGLNSEITLVPIADLVPFHSRTDAGLRVKRLKEPSSSAELVLVHPLSQLSHVGFHHEGEAVPNVSLDFRRDDYSEC